MTRKRTYLLIGLAVLVVLGLVGAALAIDPIVRSTTQKLATQALKVPVRLEGATVKYAGSLRLDKFEIANPAGYKEPHACAFERFDISVKPKSLFSSVVEIGEVGVIKPDLTIEFVGTKSNWSTLMGNLGEGDKQEPSGKGAEKKFHIGKARVEGATVRFRSDLLPGGATSFTLPAIEIRDIGTAAQGAPMSEVLARLMHSLVNEAMKAGQGSLPKELLGQLGNELKGAAERFKGLLLEAPIQDLKEVPGKAAEEAQKKLRDLLQKKK